MIKKIKKFFLERKISKIQKIIDIKKKFKKDFMKLENEGRMRTVLGNTFNFTYIRTNTGGMRDARIDVELQDGSTYCETSFFITDALKKMYNTLYEINIKEFKQELKKLKSKYMKLYRS
jgi:hypothetical protein